MLSEQNITHQATTTDGLPDPTSTGVKERESCLHLHLVEKPQTILLHREKMEDQTKEKRCLENNQWGLNIAGFKFSQNQVEGKWRSLIASHKTLRDNKTKTGQKRKTFQYYERTSAIVSNRHDIKPPFLSGTDVSTS